MTDFNPIRQTLKNLANEFQSINTSCLHFDVQINALIEARTKDENKKFRRRFCRFLRLVDALKPETSIFYKDKSQYILGMLQHIEAHYDDLKRRYFWALDRLAEMTIKLNHMSENQLRIKAKKICLGNSWEDFYRNMEKENSNHSSNYIKIENVIGMTFTEDEEIPKAENIKETHEKKRKESKKIDKSVQSTSIEDLSQIDTCETEDSSKRNKEISRKFEKSRKITKCSKASQELANISEMKMQIYALMTEVAERDEMIDSLIAQIKIKDTRIAQLVEVVRQEKLGFHKDVCKYPTKEAEQTK